jgi:hypothetical protein
MFLTDIAAPLHDTHACLMVRWKRTGGTGSRNGAGTGTRRMTGIAMEKRGRVTGRESTAAISRRRNAFIDRARLF